MRVFISLLLALCFSIALAPEVRGGCLKGDCDNGHGTYAFSDGSIYVGRWKNNKFNGQGAYTFPDGSTYVGQWKNAMRNGRGTYTRPSGSKYTGLWKDDKYEGKGNFTYPDGSTYIGQWKNNMRNGQGIYTAASGSKYTGQWKNGRLIGKGILVTAEGKKYEGHFDKDGKLIGKYILLTKKKPDKEETKVTAKAKAKAEAEAKAKAEAKKKAEEETRLAAKAKAKAKAEAAAEAKAKAEAKKKAEEEARLAAKAEAKAKAEAEAKAKTEAAAEAKAKAEAKKKAEEETRLATEAEAKAAVEATAKVEAEAKAKAKTETAAEAKAKAVAKKKAEEETRLAAEAEAKAKAEAEAKAKARAKAKVEVKVIKQDATTSEKGFTGPNGMKFVYVTPGTFTMGSPGDEAGRYDNEIRHKVTLTQGFYIQTTEVTQGQWKAVMGDNPSYFKGCGDDCPVEQVSWKDAQQFIWRLNQLEGAEKYRLPTEAEWEYACRAGSSTAFFSGGITELECGPDPSLADIAWFCGSSDKKTHPVARKNANAWGLYDVHGNVAELCRDWFVQYTADDTTDPTGPASGLDRSVRGGGLDSNARHCRSSCRGAIPVGTVDYGVGFRLARTP